ncbi:MAG: hypothetical protein AB9903_25125 [Vulcanimicrobiota bacterium]
MDVLTYKFFKSGFIVHFIIGLLLFFALMHPAYCDPFSSAGPDNIERNISIEEFEFIFNKFLVPDLQSWEKKDRFAFESMEIVNHPSTSDENGCTTISIKQKSLNFTIKYGIYKNIWHTSDKMLRVYSLHGPRWQTPVTHDWCFVIDGSGALFLLKSPERNPVNNIKRSIFNDLVNYVFPSAVTKEDFYDICMFYLNYLYSLGEENNLTVLKTVKDLPFYDVQDENQNKNKEELRSILFTKLEKVLFAPAVESFEDRHHLSLFTYLDVDSEIAEWDFDMGPDKKLNVRKTIFLKGVPRLVR